LAALLNRINQTRAEHIITLEDPIEYIYHPDKCTINQREITEDTVSYETGLKAVLREDPDIILIGEMRSLDAIETALIAAETGHLVFTTLHTNSAADSIDRIVSVFPGERQQQIRLQLSRTLRAVLSQQLLPRASGQGRVLACEVMVPNSAIRAMIREGKTPQIASAIQTSAAEGNISMDNYLANLVKQGAISKVVAVEAAHDVGFLKKLIGMSSSSTSISRDRIRR
jgi:twitching motility protein PilT